MPEDSSDLAQAPPRRAQLDALWMAELLAMARGAVNRVDDYERHRPLMLAFVDALIVGLFVLILVKVLLCGRTMGRPRSNASA
jgi:hypothetical protein